MEPMHLPGDQCEVHGSHRPAVHRTAVHHIWPLGLGGPDHADNKVRVCGTGHDTIHTNIHNLCRSGDAAQLVGSRTEKALALRGYRSWVAAGKPGTPE